MSKQEEMKTSRRALDTHLNGNGAFKFKAWVAGILVMCFALCLPFLSGAAEFEISSGIYTTHLEEYNTSRNENNNLIAVAYRFTDSDWGLLGSNFINSYDVQTNALAVTYSVIKYRALEFEMIVGMMKGYTEWELHDKLCPFGKDSDYCFLVAPKLSFEVLDYECIKPKLSVLLMGEAVIVTFGVSYEF